MKSLHQLVRIDMLKVPEFAMDHFQKEVLNHLYLEFYFDKSKVLITPDFNYITTGVAENEEVEELQEILDSHQEALAKIKKYLIYNLSLYSALLETNSFYIGLNNYMLIARFISLTDPGHFEIKLYTLNRSDLPQNYKDKLYLGRDFLSLKTFRRDYLGLKQIAHSVKEQIGKVKERIVAVVSETDRFEIEQEYLKDIEGVIDEFVQFCSDLFAEYPADIGSETVETQTLISANKKFRDAKHMLIEIEQALQDLEDKMFEKELLSPVRYVTKFKKDITNDINYLMVKVNGRISDYLNKIHI